MLVTSHSMAPLLFYGTGQKAQIGVFGGYFYIYYVLGDQKAPK